MHFPHIHTKKFYLKTGYVLLDVDTGETEYTCTQEDYLEWQRSYQSRS